jgi:hypothetical protein
MISQSSAQALLDACKDTLRRVEKSDAWWMDCPDRGGIDTELIEAAIAKTEKEMYRQCLEEGCSRQAFSDSDKYCKDHIE